MLAMPQIQAVVDYLAELAPPSLAAEWDNVGLLVGDPSAIAAKVMTCLTITEATATEAIAEGAVLIVSHHPLPFRPLKQITTASVPGKLLWKLIGEGIAIYSPHTAFDSAIAGINQLWAERLRLRTIDVLETPKDAPPGAGMGRVGDFSEPVALSALAKQLALAFGLPGIQVVGEPNRLVHRAGIACGSGGSMLPLAAKAKCDLFVTGEAGFHTCLEAESLGIAMILAGHYASERFGVESLAQQLQLRFPDSVIWASRRERDPLTWIETNRRRSAADQRREMFLDCDA